MEGLISSLLRVRLCRNCRSTGTIVRASAAVIAQNFPPPSSFPPPAPSQVRLCRNYRSTGTIVRASAAVISQNFPGRRAAKELCTDNGDGEKIRVVERCGSAVPAAGDWQGVSGRDEGKEDPL
ncbi:unnamed protein product [Closterium sp. Naga37s-1]|nr:unnamed protein product [Closterium sp. Naga37s-1]